MIMFKSRGFGEGTHKVWGGIEYVKRNKKWRPVPKGNKKISLGEKKFSIRDFYGTGRHKYFENEADMKNFKERQTQGMTGGKKGMKIKSTFGRLSRGTKVIFPVKGKKLEGNILSSNGTPSKPPTHFTIQYRNRGKLLIRKDVPRKDLERKELSWSEKKELGKKMKKERMQQENTAILLNDPDKQIQERAKDLVMSHWDLFSKMVGNYYKKRVRGGWDADRYGFSSDDLKQEAYIVVQRAATSYLKDPTKEKKGLNFVNYVKSFLKSNLAAALMVGSGSGGHLKASAKDQLYLIFFKKVVNDYRATHNDKRPPDDELLVLLENERHALPDEKGNKTVKDYEWTLEKIRNKKSMTKTMTSLDRAIDAGHSDSTTLLEILNEEELERIGGRYRMDPWIETQKALVKDGVEKAMKRVFKSKVDQEILIRSYGLFINEKSPQEVRQYAEGQTSSEIANYLNKMKYTKKIWTAQSIDEKLFALLGRFRDNQDFVKQLGDFAKSIQELDGEREWSDEELIVYWISIYQIIEKCVEEVVGK